MLASSGPSVEYSVTTAAVGRITELESVISELQIGHEESEKRWEGTVGQQTKLIDFLQAKSEAPPKRKVSAKHARVCFYVKTNSGEGGERS